MLYKRGKVWWIKIMYNGQLIRRTTGATSKELARRIELTFMSRLAEGQWFEKDPAEDTCFRHMWEKYLEEEVKHASKSNYPRAQQCAKHFLPFLGDLKLSQITPSLLSTYKAKRLNQVKAATVVKELTYIRRVFTLCKKEWQLVKQSPFEFFTMPKVNNSRVRFLEEGQFDKLVTSCPSWLTPVVILARYTGMRKGNILTLTWSRIDFQNRIISLDETKNGHPLMIPFSDTTYSTLHSLRNEKVVRLGCPYVFHDNGMLYSPHKVSMAFKRACERAEIENFRFHDLRHDFASNLVQKGIDLYPVQLLLGHRDGRMTQRYAHLKVEHLRKAVDTLEMQGGHKIGHSDKAKGVTIAVTP